MKYKEYPIAGNSMRLTSIRMQQLREMKEEEIVIRMQSPLIVRRHDSERNTDTYYTCGMEGFERTLKENTDFFIEKMSLPVSTEKFSIEMIKGKKVVILGSGGASLTAQAAALPATRGDQKDVFAAGSRPHS